MDERSTMEELVKWLKDNIGDNIQIITPQFERTEPLAFEWNPRYEWQVIEVLRNAPWKVLKGLGFGKWSNMNEIIAKNKERRPRTVSIPFINKLEESFIFSTGCKDAPTELLEVDEDVILFPGEWYNLIPDGIMVTGLYGNQYPFKKGESDDDIRFGCLAYGIRRPIESCNK